MEVSKHFGEMTKEREQNLIKLIDSKAEPIRATMSICPDCYAENKFEKGKIDAVIYSENGKVWIAKECKEHGITKELYWSDAEMYNKAKKYEDEGIKITNPHIKKENANCPFDCGLCNEHESHTALGNIAITNRCDRDCFYCFFYAKKGDPIYEPSLDQLRIMLRNLKNVAPVGCNAVQLTGGEPTIRDDIIDIIKIAREEGFDHVQLNTNGVRLSKSLEFCNQVKSAGSNVLYMSFDGLTPTSNIKNYWEIPQAIENCRQAKLGVVLVPTIIKGINDTELGDIIRLGFGNIDTVRAVNFQPVSLVGMMRKEKRAKERITIPGAIKRIELQTDGQITKDDFFSIPCAQHITNFVEAIKGTQKYRLSAHFACGMATYVFKDRDKIIPLPQFFDVNGFFEYLSEKTEKINTSKFKPARKALTVGQLMLTIKKFVDNDKKPKSLNFTKMLTSAVTGGSYGGLRDLHHNSMLIGMMHFQDLYNYDVDRVHKCCIHYATPDNNIIPFCAFNVLPEVYRDKIQRQYSLPHAEWEQKTGKKLADDRKRKEYTEEEKQKINEWYAQYRQEQGKQNLPGEWE